MIVFKFDSVVALKEPPIRPSNNQGTNTSIFIVVHHNVGCNNTSTLPHGPWWVHDSNDAFTTTEFGIYYEGNLWEGVHD